MRKTILLAAVFGLAGCAYPDPRHVQALDALVNHPEADLVRAMGVPSRSYDTGGHRFLAYSQSRLVTLPGSGFYGGGFGWGYGGYGYGGGWGGFPPEIEQRDCETTFDLAGGVVRSWSLRGNAC